MKTPNERFKDIRLSLRRKPSQERFAEILGVSLSTVYKIEKGATITNDVLIALEEKVNVNPNYITSGKGEKFKNGQMPEFNETDSQAKNSTDPWRDALVMQLKYDAETWKEKYEQVWNKFTNLLERVPLGKYKPVKETALAKAG